MNWRMPIFPNKSAENEIAGFKCPPEKKLFFIIFCAHSFLSNFKICTYKSSFTSYLILLLRNTFTYQFFYYKCHEIAFLSVFKSKTEQFYILLKPGLTSKLKPGTEFPGLLACFLSRKALFLATAHDSIAFCCGCQIQNRPETLMAK